MERRDDRLIAWVAFPGRPPRRTSLAGRRAGEQCRPISASRGQRALSQRLPSKRQCVTQSLRSAQLRIGTQQYSAAKARGPSEQSVTVRRQERVDRT